MRRIHVLRTEIPVRPCGGTVNNNQINLSHNRHTIYIVIACALNAPNKAEAIAITTFKTVSQVIFFITISFLVI